MIEVRPHPDIVYNFSENIFIKEGYLDTSICDNLVNENQNLVLKGSSTYWKGTYHKFDLSPDHKIHESLTNIWNEVINFYNAKIDFIEPYNLKKYSFGNYYGEHTDHYTCISKNIDRRLSMVVQLTDSKKYGSGDLEIANVKMPREKGTVIVFPSNFKHKVNPVGFGERWVLISWAWGPIL